MQHQKSISQKECHPEPFTPLLPLGQRGDLNGQRPYILLIADVEAAAGEVDGGSTVVGAAVVTVRIPDRSILSGIGQVPGCVRDRGKV